MVSMSIFIQSAGIFIFSAILINLPRLIRMVDRFVSNFATPAFEIDRRIPTAPITIISNKYVRPIPEKSKTSTNTRTSIQPLAPIEHWLLAYPIDYTFFYDYRIDPEQFEQALSQLLTKVPVIGGKICKINDHALGIDYKNPKVQLTICETEVEPSIEDKDINEPNWYGKFTNGANHALPYPNQEAIFKVMLTYYHSEKVETKKTKEQVDIDSDKDKEKEKEKEEQKDSSKDSDKNSKKTKNHTLMAIGCMHGAMDGEAFFMVLQCLAEEMKACLSSNTFKPTYEIPSWDRSKLLIPSSQLRTFEPDAIILNKSFSGMIDRTLWFLTTRQPSRRWRPKTIYFTTQDIENLKQKALSGGRKSTELKQMKLSTNDVITALFWKIRATLNSGYSMDEPIICTMVINTRGYLTEKFPKRYLGNALAFLPLHATREELVHSDFSEVVYLVRTAVNDLKKEQFEEDLHLYQHMYMLDGATVEDLYVFHCRWHVPGHGMDLGRWRYDRDLMVSNLQKLPALECNLGQGNPFRVRFNFAEDSCSLGYFFTVDRNTCEYYMSIPEEDAEFYENVDIKDPELDWEAVNKKYAKYKPMLLRRAFNRRWPVINLKAIFDGRQDTEYWKW